jgi:DNA mismatch repair protein MutS
MAGIPSKVITRAQEMLKHLESTRSAQGKMKADDETQLSFFQLDDPVLSQVRDEIINTDIDHLTPVQALNKLQEIKRIIIR